MKKLLLILISIVHIYLLTGCQPQPEGCDIAATTLPVYEFTSYLCEGTDLQVKQIVNQNVSCLHDYTLQSSQMRIIEEADTLVISGGGLEDFLEDVLSDKSTVIDASVNIDFHCGNEDEHSHDHSHEKDPHIWLSPANAKVMTNNICQMLIEIYPQYADIFSANFVSLAEDFDALQAYGNKTLSHLTCRKLITFHDGFFYFADAFDLTILKAIEEDSGSEASAAELKELIALVNSHKLPAIFTETNGSETSAKTISTETGVSIYALDMVMSGENYFDMMYRNIDTIKEALG